MIPKAVYQILQSSELPRTSPNPGLTKISDTTVTWREIENEFTGQVLKWKTVSKDPFLLTCLITKVNPRLGRNMAVHKKTRDW